MMKQTCKLISVSLVMILALAACTPREVPASLSASTSVSSPAAASITFTDALGRTVTVNEPRKVAAVNGSYAEVWLLAGGELAAVTEDAWYERSLALPEETVSLGAMKAPNMEQILAEGIDFVLLSSKVAEHVKLLDTLEAAGVSCAYFEVETFDDYLAMLKICTDITGKPEMYEANGTHVEERIQTAIARSEGKPSPTVLFIRAFSTGAKAKGSDNMTGIMLKELGCTNIADSETGLLEDVSIEKVIAEDPDYIFVVTMGESSEKAIDALEKNLISNPAWVGLSAVKNNRYVVLPKELFHYKPNARWGESYEMLADILYGKE
ncbi:MAG: ABC transporter substrate-binding protein [Angelakisella sp.]